MPLWAVLLERQAHLLCPVRTENLNPDVTVMEAA
jgi:hypothetical protein